MFPIHTYVYTYMYMYIHTCICTYIYMYARHTYTCMYTCMYVVDACMYAAIHACMYVTCMYVCIHRWETQRLSPNTTRSQNCRRHISIWVTLLHASHYCMRRIIICVTFLPAAPQLPSQYLWDIHTTTHNQSHYYRSHTNSVQLPSHFLYERQQVNPIPTWVPVLYIQCITRIVTLFYASQYSTRHIFLGITLFYFAQNVISHSDIKYVYTMHHSKRRIILRVIFF